MPRAIGHTFLGDQFQIGVHAQHHNELADAANEDDTRITDVETSAASNLVGITFVSNQLGVLSNRIDKTQDSVLFEGPIAATTAIPVLVAKVPLRIVTASLAVWTGAQTASDTDFWTVALRRYRAGTPATIATKTTQVTGGAAIVNKVDWPVDTAFNATNNLCVAGDVIDFNFTKAASASDLTRVLLTVGYKIT